MKEKKPNQPQEAVLYARFSPRRNPEKCDSCEAQLEILRKRAEIEGWKIIGEFADEGRSGSDMNREGLQQALDLVIKRKAILAIYSLSRLARSTLACLDIAKRIGEAGANLHVEKERLSTTGKYDRFIFTIFAALAQLEREQISERTSDCMRAYMAQGRKMGGKAPYGYRFEGDRMVPDPYEQRCVRRIIELRQMTNAQGKKMSMLRISRRLTYEGFRPRNAKGWDKKTIWRILRDHNAL